MFFSQGNGVIAQNVERYFSAYYEEEIQMEEKTYHSYPSTVVRTEPT